MFVCVCFSVSDDKLKEFAEKGYTFQEISLETRAGTNCGSCEEIIKYILEEHNDPSV